jgi:hypothetical protein
VQSATSHSVMIATIFPAVKIATRRSASSAMTIRCLLASNAGHTSAMTAVRFPLVESAMK